jgi:hypothetical protein
MEVQLFEKNAALRTELVRQIESKEEQIKNTN